MADETVRAWTPFTVVDAVEDAEQPLLTRAQQRVESHAESLGLDLACVSRADGRDRVGVDQSGLEEVDSAGVQVVLVEKVGPGSEPEFVDDRGIENSLVADVVDRQQVSAGVEQAVPLVSRARLERQEAGVPIVGVEYVGAPLQTLARVQHRTRKEREAPVLVAVVGIDPVAVVQRGAVDEVDRQVAPRQHSRPQREVQELAA